jgi:hypothetical protein
MGMLMLAADSLRNVRDGLNEAFARRPAWSGLSARLVCLLFAPPGSKITKDEILPRWDDFHHRSGEDVDFFCAGYGAFEGDSSSVVATTTNPLYGKVDWHFYPEMFNIFVREVEESLNPKWNYSGEADLLRYSEGYVSLDLSSPVLLNLLKMKEDKAIDSASELFETIIHYAPAQRSDNPAWGYSDAMGLGEMNKWIIEWITSLLPAKLGKAWIRGRHFAVVV